MSRPAPHVALEDPFDDINAIGSSTNTANPSSARVPANAHGDTAVTRAWSRRFHSMRLNIYTALHPALNRKPKPPAFLLYSMFFIAACFSVATSALDVYGFVGLIPLVPLLGAFVAAIASIWAIHHLLMPCYIASYMLVFVVTITIYLLDKHHQPYQRTTLIVIMSVWCAVIPVVMLLAWSFWKPVTGVIGARFRQSRQQPSHTAIELSRLPHEPLPAATHPAQQPRPGLSVDHNRSRWESRRRSSVSDDDFQRVREFV